MQFLRILPKIYLIYIENCHNLKTSSYLYINITNTMIRLIYLLIIPIIFCQCNKSTMNKTVVNRFDKELIHIIENYSDSASVIFNEKYSDILSIYYSAILKGNSDSLDNKSKIEFISQCLNNLEFNKLYNDVQFEFTDLSKEEIAINKGIKIYSEIFNDSFAQYIYSHVSPFGYSVITTDSLISISLDNYMGKDYDGYKGIFYNYQLHKKERSRIALDIFRGWIYAKYPNNAKSLIDGMIYEGAVVYALEKILDEYSAGEIIGYNKDKSKWCEDNEKDIWNAIIESNHLYSKENITYIKYLNEAPYCSALNGDVPAEIGKWIGYKIVAKYINDNNIKSLKDILKGEIKTIEILKSYN